MTGAVLDQLAARMRAMEGSPQVRDRLPTLPALAQVVPGGLLRGTTYEVADSLALALALAAGPSIDGAWCAVVGVPEMGAEAAASLGLALERTILVPAPGEHWQHVVSTLADVTDAIVVRPSSRVRDGDAQRITARLRQHGTTAVALTPHPGVWPRAAGRLEVTESSWTGMGDGHGHLRRRHVTVTATGRWGRPHRTRLWLDAVVEPAAVGDDTVVALPGALGYGVAS
ncbi:hypothetical protein KV102_15715 [Mumia sp. zg.B53]|uniref:hypothetical protein n=1 Tax=Mumia sp. zg.B53 TaxID=2855449 RepID=UPI001C6E49E2|nr:hypothetical protein [Mumia sp. zg.B53]MBW9216284.1 hypothetical protein [Mumia sp. zg.B53]